MAPQSKKTSENNNEKSANGKLLEETFIEVENVIENLNKDDVSLEAAFDYYKNGIELLSVCKSKLDEVEKKVMILNDGGELDEF